MHCLFNKCYGHSYLTDSMFSEQLSDFLDYTNNLQGLVCLVGDVNINFDNPQHSLTKQSLTTFSLYNLVQVINKPTPIIVWFVFRPDDDIHKKSTVADSLKSDHYCIESNFNASVYKSSITYRTVRNIVRPSYIAELSNISGLHLLKKQTSCVTLCTLC